MEPPRPVTDPVAQRSRTDRRLEPDHPSAGPGEVDPRPSPVGLFDLHDATEHVLEELAGAADIGDRMGDVIEPGGIRPRCRQVVRAWLVLPFAVGLRELHDDPACRLRVHERLFPPGVSDVHADEREAGGFGGGDGGRDVGDLERQVVRPRPTVVQEATEEVVLVDPSWFEPLQLHAVGVDDLGGIEACRFASAEPLAAELARVAGPQVVGSLGRDGHVVEHGADAVLIAHGARWCPGHLLSGESSRGGLEPISEIALLTAHPTQTSYRDARTPGGRRNPGGRLAAR